jgi:hypothetical protein
MEKYEEYNTLSSFWGWVLIIFGSAFLVGLGLLTHFLVRDTSRQWDFGQVRDIPAEAPFSTIVPSREPSVPNQLLPLPFQLFSPSETEK